MNAIEYSNNYTYNPIGMAWWLVADAPRHVETKRGNC